MFADYITGQLGATTVSYEADSLHVVTSSFVLAFFQDQRFCSNIVRIIIAGDSITDKPVKAASVKDSKVGAPLAAFWCSRMSPVQLLLPCNTAGRPAISLATTRLNPLRR